MHQIIITVVYLIKLTNHKSHISLQQINNNLYLDKSNYIKNSKNLIKSNLYKIPSNNLHIYIG